MHRAARTEQCARLRTDDLAAAGRESPAAPAIAARGLAKAYDGLVAVDRIDFTVRAGECFGFLGPNGAGKTSTMKMIYGLATVGGGELSVLGLDARTQRRAIKARLGVVPQQENLDRELTVLENLVVHAGYFGIDPGPATARAEDLLAFVQLEGKRGARIEALSGGMKHRLLIARALVAEPELVVLDEPTTGLDPQARHAVWDELRNLKGAGVTQVLTTHYMEEATQLCDRLVIMDHGHIIARGSPQELIAAHCEGDGSLEDVFLTLTGRHLRE